MGIEYNECHYGGMYNINVKRIFVITEFVHMNAGVNSEKENVKESQSQTVTKRDTHTRHPLRVPGRGRHTTALKIFHISVPSFGTDQTVVQGLKPTQSSTKHLSKV